MKIDIDFDDLLRRSVNASIDATVKMSDTHPEFSSRSEQLQLIATVSAHTTIQILREYHEMLENSLNSGDTTR